LTALAADVGGEGGLGGSVDVAGGEGGAAACDAGFVDGCVAGGATATVDVVDVVDAMGAAAACGGRLVASKGAGVPLLSAGDVTTGGLPRCPWDEQPTARNALNNAAVDKPHRTATAAPEIRPPWRCMP
jgi:hypothetical protein